MPTELDKTLATFKVVYEDGTSDIIKPVSWKKLEDVEILCLEILKSAYKVNFCIADIFKPKNTEFWDNAKKLASLLPVVGKEDPGFDPTRIESIEALASIFISTSKFRNPATGSLTWGQNNESIFPSEICRIHNLNFLNLLLEVERQVQEEIPKTKTSPKRKSSSLT